MLATLGYSIAGGLQAGTGGLATLGYGIGEGVTGPGLDYTASLRLHYTVGKEPRFPKKLHYDAEGRLHYKASE